MKDKKYNIFWKDSQEYVSSAEELDELLEKIAVENKEEPIIVDIAGPGEYDLQMGVGSDSTLLSFITKLGDQYLASIGDKNAKGVVLFSVGGEPSEPTEFEEKHLIPWGLGKEAAKEYLLTGELSNKVNWE